MQMQNRRMRAGARRVAGVLACLTATGAATPAMAELVEYRFNFGADISGTAGYADYVQGDVIYSDAVGHGFTFRSDPTAGQNVSMQSRDRSDTGDPTPQNTLVLDLRADAGDTYNTGGDPAPLYDPFTFRVDLPDGLYEIQVGMGDPLTRLVTDFYVGDTFRTSGNVTALDATAADSVLLAAGNFTSEGDYEVLPLSGVPVQFEVTEGYLLLGFRRSEGTIRFGGLNDVTITAVPEPGALTLLGLGGAFLLRRRRVA